MHPGSETPVFSIDVTRDGAVVTVTVTGEIDAATAGELETALVSAVPGATSIDVDMAAVGFMDSSGLRAMVIAMYAADEAGVPLRIVATTPTVDRLLSITGLTEKLT